MSKLLDGNISTFGSPHLLPTLYVTQEVQKLKRRIPIIHPIKQYAEKQIEKLMGSDIHGNVGDDTRTNYATALLRMRDLDSRTISTLKARLRPTQPSFFHYLDRLVGPNPTADMLEVIKLYKLVRFFRLYSGAADQLSDIFASLFIWALPALEARDIIDIKNLPFRILIRTAATSRCFLIPWHPVKLQAFRAG